MAKSPSRRQRENPIGKTPRRPVILAARPKAGPADPARILSSDLPSDLPVDKRELALWRAFLADEIEAILRDGD